MDIISSVQTAIDITKKLREYGKKIQDVEFKMLLADLTDQLGDTKIELADMKSQMAELMEENSALMAQLAARSNDVPETMAGGYKFGEDGPFCTACFESHGKKIKLSPATGIHSHFGKWRCPVCKEHS